MTTLREAAQQALEQLKINRTNFRKGPSKSISKMLAGGNDEAIADLESALAEYDKDRVKVEEMKANWALQRKLAKETQERGKQQREYEEQRLAALAEPEGGGNLPPPLQEPTVAENATTQQQLEDTPPSDYRRGYWDGFNIGKREGRIEAEDALAEPVQEPDLSRCPQCGGPADNGHDRSIPPNPYFCTKCMAEPVQEPVAWVDQRIHGWPDCFVMEADPPHTTPLYAAPPRCPNCASLEAQNTELDAKLADLEQTSLELCEVCGWKTLIPGDCCLNCARINPCPNCASLQDQNTELDRKLAELTEAVLRANGIRKEME